ncbi:arsenic transporter [Janthinobacterium aquaticum]|uniref:arsenic transporter n=1 Tax=Janthinobacterium sp. FT58W TaxID=2654254 RepID=UPI001264704E|nr:arsenic transporter [Janthinobacterium sp. FT58W]KAB8044208.1 arsenic transporter [Janthinobacterium sp. FT58W]
MSTEIILGSITVITMAGITLRPWRLPEAVWGGLAVAALLLFKLMTLSDVWHGIARGNDVYLFLAGMMILAELGRQHGVFDWLASHAARAAGGSGSKLFLLVYLAGTLVTVLLSNDATAVVLTPAVYAVARAVDAPPLPYLFLCAFVANAASFVLPVSNPANLVVFGAHMPGLADWLALFLLPSLGAIVATYLALRWLLRDAIQPTIRSTVEMVQLTPSGRLTLAALAATALVLCVASALHLELGPVTLGAAVLALLTTCVRARTSPTGVLRALSWDVLLMVASLFVLIEALQAHGVVAALAQWQQQLHGAAPQFANSLTGTILALASNLFNNLPTGLLGAATLDHLDAAMPLRAASLIGIDIGPNLSVTGSLATILWLTMLRREGVQVGAWQFLKLGALVMPAGLLAALLLLQVQS